MDPNGAPLRSLPREDRDLFIAATNSHVQAFDNVSGMPQWTSDALCRLSTGGSFATRQLYTDGDEMLFEASRPVILNGITDIVTRPTSSTAPSPSPSIRFPTSAADPSANCGPSLRRNNRAFSACCSTQW